MSAVRTGHGYRMSRLVHNFEQAVMDHAFLGTIPLYGQDAEEQQDINRARGNIKRALTRTRNALLKELAK